MEKDKLNQQIKELEGYEKQQRGDDMCDQTAEFQDANNGQIGEGAEQGRTKQEKGNGEADLVSPKFARGIENGNLECTPELGHEDGDGVQEPGEQVLLNDSKTTPEQDKLPKFE